MAQVVLKDLAKKFDEVVAVRDVNLQIKDKEFVVLVGPSGCGKSTTLADDRGARGDQLRRDLHRRPAGQRSPAEGSRHRDGLPELRALSPHDRLRQHGVRAEDAEVPQARDRDAGARGGPDAGHPGAPEPEAPPALGRPAAARRGGPRHRPASPGVPLRRAPVEPGREAPGADARGAEAPPRSARDHRHLRDPRPGRGDDARRPRGGHEGRARAAGGRTPHRVRQAAQSVRGGLHRIPGDELHRLHGDRHRRAAWPSTRRAASSSRCRTAQPGVARALPRPAGDARHPPRGRPGERRRAIRSTPRSRPSWRWWSRSGTRS